MDVSFSSLMPKVADQTETARELVISGIAAPFHGNTQTTVATNPAKIENMLRGTEIRTIAHPIRKVERGISTKKATET